MPKEHSVIMAGEIMEKTKIPFALMASTLLGIYRDGKPIGKRFEFAVLASDIDDKAIERLRDVWGERKVGTRDIRGKSFSKERKGDIFIIDLIGIRAGGNFELHPIHFNEKYSYQHITEHGYLVWPRDIWERKNWERIKWNGKWWNTPSRIEDCLRFYYGEDWKTPQPFFWRRDAFNKSNSPLKLPGSLMVLFNEKGEDKG